MAGQKVDDIRVGLGLSLGQLESDASAAKAKLAELEKPREVPISIKVRLTGKEGEEAATKIKQNIQTALDSLKKSGTFDITPKLTRNTISDMKKAIREELRAHPVEIPVAVKMTQADGTRIRRDIEAGIGVVKIGFDYYWVNGPPDLGGSGGPSHGGPQGGGGHGGGGRPPAGAGTSGPAAPSTPPSSGSGPRAQRSAANKAAHAAQRSPSQAASDAKARGQQPPPPASQATQQPPSSPPPSSGGEDARGRFTSRSAAPQAAPPAQQPAAQEPTVNRGTRTRSAPRRASTPGTVAATPPAATSASSVAEAVTSSVMSGGSRGPAPEPNVRGRASRRNGYRTGGAPRGFGDPGEPMEPAAVRRRDRNQQIAEDRAAQQRADQEADRRVGVFPQHSAVKNALRNFESDPLELVAIAPHAAAALLNYEQDPVTAGQKTRATEPTLGSRRHGGRRSLRRRVGKARAGKLKLDRYDEQGRYLGPVDDVALLTAASMEAVGTESDLARDPNAILKIGAGRKGGTRRSRRPKNVATPEAVRKQIAKGTTADVQTPSLIEALNAAQREGMTVEEVIDSMKSQDPTLAAAGVMALDPTIQPQRREDTRRKVTKVKEESDRSPLPENRPGSPPVGTPVSLDAQLVAAEEARARAAAADARDAKSRSEADAKERTKKQAEAAAEAAAKKAEKIASYERAWSAIPEETRRRLLQDPNRDQFFQSRYGDWRPPAFAGGGYYRVYRAGMIDAPGKGGSFLRKLGNQGDFGLAVSGMTPSDRLRRVLDGEEIGSAWVSHDTDSVQRYLRRETHTDNRTHRWWREKGQHLGLPEDQAADIGRKMTARTAARTMIHEGSILSSQWGKAIGPGDGSPGELEVANPKYLINHLAGPKGPLPRAGGGIVAAANGITFRKTAPTARFTEDLEGLYPFGPINLAGVHPDHLPKMMAALETLGQRYPVTARHITGVEAVPEEWLGRLAKTPEGGRAYALTLPTGGNTSQLLFNRDVFADKHKVYGGSGHMFRTGPDSIVAHEFGHAWDIANGWGPSNTMAAQRMQYVSEYGRKNPMENLAELFTKGYHEGLGSLPEMEWGLMAGPWKRANGGPVKAGGLLARMLAATTTGTTITPGMEARSQQLNALLGIARGGTSESGGAMLPSSTPAPMSAAADRRLRFLQGKAEGGWVPGFGRGGAYTMYHGTKGRPFREFDPRRFRTESLFGPGAYLTNDKDLAKSYTGDSRLGTILKAKVRAGTRTLDVENPRHHRMLEHEMAQVVDFIDPGRGPLFREYARGIMEDAELSGRPELKPYRMYEAFADVASDLSAATQLGERTIHEELQHRLRKKGYAGFSHWGGTYLGGKKHKVNVLWDTDRLEPLKKAPKDPRRAKFLFGQEKMMWEYLEDLEGELPFMGGMNPGSQADLQARVAFLRDMKAKGAMWTTATLHEGKPRDGRPYLAGAGVWHDVQGNVFSDGSALDRTVGRSTFSSDDRTEAKHLKYLKGVFQRRGFKFADGGGVSPWVRRAQAGQLPAVDRTGAIMARQLAPHWASGKLPPLADHPGAVLMGERGPEKFFTPLGVTTVGRHGPEVVLPGVDGEVEANHQQGKLAGKWRQLALRRMDEMERRVGGGPINPGGPNAPTLRFRLGNRFASQAQASAAAVQAGTAAIYNAPAPMRVIVLNWPASLTQPAPSAAPGGGGQPQPGVQTRQPRNRQQANTVVTPNTPPGPGGPGAPGVPPPGSGGSPRATPLQQQRSFNTSLSSLDALRNRLQQVRIGTSDALQLTPVRALSVSVGQQFQELFGGRRDIRERARVATYEADRASRFAAQQESRNRAFEDQRAVLAEMKANPTKYTAQQYTDARDKFLKLRQARDLAVRQTEAATLRSEIVLKGEDKLVKEKPGQEQEIRQLAGQLRQENQNVKAPTGGVLQRGNVLKAQALGVAGIVGGTVLFSAAMGAAQAGLMALSKVVGNAAESLMGFASTTTRVTGELAGAVQGQGNLAGAGLSTKFAQLGIDSSKLGNVRQASIAQAGAQNLQGQIDLLRSERNLGQRDMTKLGTFQGFGNGPLAGVPGLGWIGQTPGAIEQLVNNLKTPATEENVNNLVRTGVFTTEPSKATTDLQRFIDDQVRSAQYSINALSNQFSGRTANITGMTAEQARAANAPFIAQTNQNATKGGFKGSLVALSGPELEASTTALKAVGPEAAGLAEQLHSLGMGLKTAAGTMPTADEWKSYWQSVVQGANAPSIPEMITAMRPQLTAQARSIQRNRAFTEQTQIPVQFGAQLLANPLSANPSQGITATSNQLGSQYAGQPAAMDQGQLSDYIAQIGETRDDLDALRDKGIQTMLDLGVPQETIDSVGKLGGQIRDLSDSAESLQLGYQTAQYNRQLYLAKRALSDIIGLQGKSSAATAAGTVNASKMGELQRAQLQDERELARIQIARSRREIEFNLALSRLSTPGATAEERATRRAEAEAIAREQKKELNIQERSTLRGFRIQDIGISRDARDAIFAIKDLQAQQGLAIQLRGIEKLIEAKQQMLQVRQAYLDTAIEAGISLKRLANDAQGQFEAATGDFTDTYKGELETVFDLIVKDSVKAYNDFIKQTGAPSLSPDQGGDTPQNHGNYATGTPGFRVSSPTRFTAGEAGSEEVIVLRNPRSGMTTAMSPAWDGSGGAPVMLTVNMNGMVVRSNQDIDEIVRRVERLLNEKAAMMGAFGRS